MHICIALNCKLLYPYGVRIDIRASAADHGITPDEIRAVVTFPVLRLTLAPAGPTPHRCCTSDLPLPTNHGLR